MYICLEQFQVSESVVADLIKVYKIFHFSLQSEGLESKVRATNAFTSKNIPVGEGFRQICKAGVFFFFFVSLNVKNRFYSFNKSKLN